VVEMGERRVIQMALPPLGVHAMDITRYPLAWPLRGIRARGRVVARLHLLFTIAGPGVDQEGGTIGQDKECRIAGAGIDMMDIEHPSFPRRQWLARGRQLGLGSRRDHEGLRQNTKGQEATWSSLIHK